MWCIDLDIYTNRVPGSLYAICRVHQNGDDFNEWRARSHACCIYFIYLIQDLVLNLHVLHNYVSCSSMLSIIFLLFSYIWGEVCGDMSLD
jgi:hypothetical protein